MSFIMIQQSFSKSTLEVKFEATAADGSSTPNGPFQLAGKADQVIDLSKVTVRFRRAPVQIAVSNHCLKRDLSLQYSKLILQNGDERSGMEN